MITAATLLVVVAAAVTPTPTPAPAPQRPNLTMLPHQAGDRPVAPNTSLADIASRIKLRLPAGAGHRITNEDLPKLAAGVELTTAQPSGEDGVSGSGVVGPAPGGSDGKREYWQNRYWEAQRLLEELEGREKFLQSEVARLEREFYARDDPAQRDGVIKPAWDRALIDLRTVQQGLEMARQAPGDIVEQARRDGAQPGWFRERAPRDASPQPQRQRYDEQEP